MTARSPKLIAWLLAAGIAGLCLLAWWLGHSPAAPAGSMEDPPSALMGEGTGPVAGAAPAVVALPVTGEWKASLAVGQQQYELLFRLAEQGERLSGTVRFPVGEGVVQSGSRHGNQISLVTQNQAAASGQQLLTRFEGSYEGSLMHLVMKTDTGSDALTLERVR